MAKQEEILLRSWEFDKSIGITLTDVYSALSDVLEAGDFGINSIKKTNYPKYDSVALYCNEKYLQLNNYLYNEKGKVYWVTSVSGKGEQIRAKDLEKLYQKASGAWGLFKAGVANGKDLAARLHLSTKAAGIGAGIGVASGLAIKGVAGLAAKGIRALVRDKEAYKKEMDFYNKALGIIDYVAGGIDSTGIVEAFKKQAEQGKAISQYMIGVAYAEGRGVAVDEIVAFEWFEKAAMKGELRSQNIVSEDYLFGEKDYSLEKKQVGLKYLVNLADNNVAWAPQLLLEIYTLGNVSGIPADPEKTFEYARKYAAVGNIYAAQILAWIYDSVHNDGIFSKLVKYNDDEKAAEIYQRLIEVKEPDISGNAALSLGKMTMEGRGVQADNDKAIDYFQIASNYGSLEAKVNLIKAYNSENNTTKPGIEAFHYANEIIRKGNEEYLPEAYYFLFKKADGEEQFKKSMKYAQEYIACNNADFEKKERLQRYLDEMKSKIGQMTDEERRVFLKEPKPFAVSSKAIKWILIGCGIAALIAFAIAYFNNEAEDATSNADYSGYIDEDTTAETKKYSKGAEPALKAYNELLTGEDFDRNSLNRNEENSTNEEWDPAKCKFNTAFIDDDEIPELILESEETTYGSGHGQIYTFQDNMINSVTSVHDISKEGYYEKTGYYTDSFFRKGFGYKTIVNMNNAEDCILMHYESDGDDYSVTGFEIGNDECTEEEYDQKIKEMIGNTKLTSYKLFNNTAENRDNIFALSGSDTSAYRKESPEGLDNESAHEVFDSLIEDLRSENSFFKYIYFDTNADGIDELLVVYTDWGGSDEGFCRIIEYDNGNIIDLFKEELYMDGGPHRFTFYPETGTFELEYHPAAAAIIYNYYTLNDNEYELASQKRHILDEDKWYYAVSDNGELSDCEKTVFQAGMNDLICGKRLVTKDIDNWSE